MRLVPVAPLWVLLPIAALALGACAIAARRHGRRWAWGRRALAVVLLTGIALRPGSTAAEGAGVTTDLDVFVLVDRTASMVAEDYDGSTARLEGVKADLVTMARGLVGSRFALIGYDNNVVDLMPLTNDLGAFAVTVEILHPEMTTYSTGSSPRLPVSHLRQRLLAAAEQDPDRRRVVVLVSDGEATTEEPVEESFAPIADLIDGGVVLGYGTAAGGPMREWSGIEGRARAPFVLDPSTGGVAVSRIDEATLRAVAEEMDVGYVHRTSPGGMDAVLAELGTGSGRQMTVSELTVTQDRSWILAWPLLALVLIEVAVAVAELARMFAAAPPRGDGMTTLERPAPVLGPSAPRPPSAGEGARRHRRRRLLVWSLLPALLLLAVAGGLLARAVATERGIDALERATFARERAVDAVTWFDRAGRFDITDRERPAFNRGVAWFRAGELGRARQEFEAALRVADEGARCRVVVNLALTVEAQGDVALDVDPVESQALFAEAKGIAQGSPVCLARTTAAGDGEGDRLARLLERLAEKMVHEAGQEVTRSRSDAGGTRDPDDNFSELEQQLDENAEARSEGRELEEEVVLDPSVFHGPQW